MKHVIITAVIALLLPLSTNGEEMKKSEMSALATFAGGCFWCMEPPFDKLEGVISTTSGYTGGSVVDPTYEEVCAGKTGHTEALQIEYDPTKVTYAELLEVYWRNVDPTTPDRQFCDLGEQYRPEIFYHDERQKEMAEASKKRLEESGRFERIAVRISPATVFYPAEEYHQSFYEKNPDHYKRYRMGCGRDNRLDQLWGEFPERILPKTEGQEEARSE